MDIKNVLKASFFVVKNVVKKHAPEICIVAGSAGLVTGGIVACVKTAKKAQKIMEQHEAEVDCVKNEDLEEKEESKELTKVYVRTGYKFAKLYSVPTIINLASGALIFLGTGLFRNRLTQVSMAAASIGGSFLTYRERVSEKIGKEEEEKLYFGIKEETVSEKITDENGKTKTVKKTKIVDADPVSKYYIRLDDNWQLWNPDRQYVVGGLLFTLMNGAQEYLNRKRWMSYNQFCEMFGFPECVCPDGQLLGWAYIEGADNTIKFVGLDDQINRFINGEQDFLILKPNFDGDIHELIPTGQKKFLEEELV